MDCRHPARADCCRRADSRSLASTSAGRLLLSRLSAAVDDMFAPTVSLASDLGALGADAAAMAVAQENSEDLTESYLSTSPE